MSNPPSSAGRPTLNSPRVDSESRATGHGTPVSSSPGTANPLQAHTQENFHRLAPAGAPESSIRQYERPPAPSEPPMQTPSRGLGVHSMLNPSSEPNTSSATPLHTPRSTVLPPPNVSPRIRKRQQRSPQQPDPHPSANTSGRRVLTPKSPANRAASLNANRLPSLHSSGVSLQSLTAPEPRIYTAEPGTQDIPALPPRAVTTRAPLSSVSGPEGPYPARFHYSGMSQSSGLPAASNAPSESPTTTHTSHSQTEHTSPAFGYGAVSSAAPGQHSLRISHSHSDFQPHHRGPEGHPTGQTGYSMTLETDDGPMVLPIEVDTQHASKTADEKRKRNAGASARFRARRKEKEKESTQTISSLQQEIQESGQERDFYHAERNFWRDFASRHVGHDKLPPRPPTPQYQPRAPRSSVSTEPSRQLEDTGRARSDSAPASQRRRTDEYQPAFASGVPPPVGPSYGPSYLTHTGLPPPPNPPAPGAFNSPRSLPPALPGLGSGPRSQSSYDPFRRDPFDRTWAPGR